MSLRLQSPGIGGALLFLICASLPAVALCARDGFSYSLSLNGDWDFHTDGGDSSEWMRSECDRAEWEQIYVPSNWYLQGKDISGVGWYHKAIELPELPDGFRYQIAFEAVDYISDVWLNGHYLGHHEGYFQPFTFDCTDAISVKGINHLLLRVDAPVESPGDWSLHKRWIKGVFGHHDTRPGGAWSLHGQECSTGGIWGSVSIQISRNLTIDSLCLVSSINGVDGNVTGAINISYPGQKPVRYTVILSVEEFGGNRCIETRKTFLVRPGKNLIPLYLDLPKVRAWWPAELGDQPRYLATVTLSKKGLIRASHSETIAFRTVECDSVTRQWFINGVRVFLRGTNYISSQWLSEMTPDKYAFDIALMRRANINAVRVHAHIEAETFYDLCDQAGLLVIQDFPLQWGYSDSPEFIANAERQAGEMVSMLSHHPSVIQWVMHNEPPWEADWMKYRYVDYNPEQNRILDQRLFETVSNLDPTRPTALCSHTKEHPWFGWYSGKISDYSKPTEQATISEFGAQALPDLGTLRTIFPDSLVWADSADGWTEWLYHNFQPHETFDLAGIPKGESVEDLIANTQAYQAELIQVAVESYRRQRYNPVTSIFQFMFAETWPSVNWGMLDYQRNPKPGYYALRNAYQPILPMAEITLDSGHFRARIFVVNDLAESFPDAKLSVTLQEDQHGIFSSAYSVSIMPDTLIELNRITIETIPFLNRTLLLRLVSREGKLLGTNRYAVKHP